MDQQVECSLRGVELGGATLSFIFDVGAAAQLSGGSAHCRLDAEHEVRSRAPKKTTDSEVPHNPIALLSQSKIKLWRLQVRTCQKFYLPSLFVVLKGLKLAELVHLRFYKVLRRPTTNLPGIFDAQEVR